MHIFCFHEPKATLYSYEYFFRNWILSRTQVWSLRRGGRWMRLSTAEWPMIMICLNCWSNWRTSAARVVVLKKIRSKCKAIIGHELRKHSTRSAIRRRWFSRVSRPYQADRRSYGFAIEKKSSSIGNSPPSAAGTAPTSLLMRICRACVFIWQQRDGQTVRGCGDELANSRRASSHRPFG